jgi:hypothetical protein
MAEVLLSIEDSVADEGGSYRARIVGRLAGDGMWEGWLEFTPLGADGGEVIVGPVESRQPERDHLVYWATGLTPVYLEGALARAKRPIVVRTRVVELPASDAPAPRVVAGPPREVKPAAVLDPFEAGARSLDVLAQELRALNRPRLLNIIGAYDLNPAGEDLSWMTDAQLERFIVVATEAQLAQRAR